MVYFPFEHNCYAIQKEYNFHFEKNIYSWQIVVTNTFYFQLVRDYSFSIRTFLVGTVLCCHILWWRNKELINSKEHFAFSSCKNILSFWKVMIVSSHKYKISNGASRIFENVKEVGYFYIVWLISFLLQNKTKINHH